MSDSAAGTDFAAGMQRWTALMQALAKSPPGSPEFQQVLLSLRGDLAAQLDAWLRASHPFTGLQFGPPTPPSASTGSAGTARAFETGATRMAELLHKWVPLQSQLAAYWSTIGRAAAAKFAARAGSLEGQSTDLRKLYNVWIDCAEEAYAETAHSEAFAHTVAEVTNTAVAFQIEVRQSLQQWARAVGLPTREEIDALTRRIEQLEQLLRRSPRPEVSAKRGSGARASGARASGTRASGTTRSDATRSSPTPSGTGAFGKRASGARTSGTRASGTARSDTTRSGPTPSGLTPSGTRPSGTGASGTRAPGTRASGTKDSAATPSGTRASRTRRSKGKRRP